MPLNIEEEICAPAFHLGAWTVIDRDALVEILAWLYLQKPHHAETVIDALEPGIAHFPGRERDSALTNLIAVTDELAAALASSAEPLKSRLEEQIQKRVEHRDGLLFQHISWVAARLRFPRAHLSPPHPRQADKGFDGVLVEFSEDNGRLSRLIICEDKATTKPRDRVTGSVWPDFEKVVAGDRDGEIMHSVTALLDRANGIDKEQVLEGVAWSRVRQFRVFVTAPTAHERDGSYRHLFAGYEAKVPDPIEGRMAEVMALGDVRKFLDDLAADVATAVRRLTDV